MSIDKRGAVAFAVILWSSKSFAFIDPFTIAAGVSAVTSLMKTSKEIDEVADIGISAGELLGEFDVDMTSDREIEEQIKRLEDLNRQSRELQDASTNARNIFDNDLDRSQSLAKKIKSIREMVKISKQVASLMGVRPKAGERALKVQETKLNYLMLDELVSIRRMQFETMLESKEQRARFTIAMERVFREEGHRNQSMSVQRLGRRL